jgi:WD40 repeat protein
MKQALVGLAMFVAMGLLSAQQPVPKDAPKETKAQIVATEQLLPAIRFNSTPAVIEGARGDALAIAVSADGKRVVSVGGSFNPSTGYVNVIDVPSKKEILSTRLPRPYNSVGISPDGKFVAMTSQSGELKLLAVNGGKTVFSKKLNSPAQVAFAADGRSIATVTQAKAVQIWDVPSGEEQANLRGATVPLQSIALSPDGKKLAAGGGDQRKKADSVANGIVFVWDIVNQRVLHKLETDEPFPVTSIAFSADSKLIVGAQAGTSGEFQLKVWEAGTGKIKTSWTAQQQLFGLAFSPGNSVAGALGDSTIRFWDPTSGDEVGIITRFTAGPARCLAFIDDGKTLVSGGGGRSMNLWDVSGKKELAVLHRDERFDSAPQALAMAATSDGSLIAEATEEKGIILRDGTTGAVKATLNGHDDTVMCVAFSPDGRTLASGSTDKTIKLWDVATAKERATLKGHTNWVFALAFSHDGKTLASGGYDRSLRLWNVETGKDEGTIEAHRGSVRAVAFSPDDQTIASGGNDRLVKLWKVADREMKTTLKGHEGSVRCLSFSSNGKVLASGGDDGSVKLWNPDTGKQQETKQPQPQPQPKAKGKANPNPNLEEVTVLAFAGDRTLISGGSNGTISQWDSSTGDMIGTLPGHNGGVSGIAVVAGGAEFFSTGADSVIKRFRQDAPGPVRLFVGHTGVIQCVSFSPDGKRFVSCGNWPEGDKTLRIWDVQKGTEILKIEQPEQAAMVLYSPDGKYVASTCGNMNVYLWDATTGKQVRVFKGHTSGVGGLAFNADGTQMLTCSVDKTVRLWDVSVGREVQKFTGHTDMVRRVAFHPDGKHALSGGRDGFVRMWELETGKEVKQFKTSGKWADCLDVSKDGKYLAIGGQTILVYNLETGKLHSECTGHQFGITHVAFSDDGKKILSASYDFSAGLWDRDTGKELYRFRAHREFLWMASFSPDGKWVLTGGGGFNAGDDKYNKGTDHAIRLWKMPDEKAIAEFLAGN